MQTNNIIDSSDPGIVVKETTVHLSDEKLKAALSRTYERAQRDMQKFKLRKHYSIFLSVAGTLFLSLLTSKFGPIGQVDSEIVTALVWGICIGSGIMGFILLAMTVSEKTQRDTISRDEAVEEIVREYIK